MQGFNENEFQQNLALYLDGALTTEESKAFIDNVMKSPEQMTRLKQEKSFREILRKKVIRHSVSPELVENIKSKIVGKIPSTY